MKNNNNFNKNVNSVDTNDNKNNNGDDFMKNNIDVMNKKTWKKLSKTNAYSEYAKLALKAIEAKELAEKAKAELLANREEILKYQEGIDEFGEHIAELDAQIIAQEERIKQLNEELDDELSVKAGMINNFRADIKRNNKAIAIAKHDIKMGVAVNRNKKWIRDLEAHNRYLQNQINDFQATFNEFKTQKTIVSETIDTKRSNYEELQDAWTVVSGVLNK